MTDRKELANAIRALSMDAVQQANSGHPGAPMGMADIAEVLWRDHLNHNPNNPAWLNRDRFVLSNGHGSMLIYALLHLTGYALSIDDIKNFRQLHSKTPGHPEVGETPGVETTTGPLGQGLANAVGMALAEKNLAAEFNRPEHDIVDHYTYVFTGDGCLMEGISHEACSLAGTLGLGKLIVFYDNNGISIDGDVNGWFTENIPQRFEAYGWQVVKGVDGHDADSIQNALAEASANTSQPTLIDCKTIIGYGAPNKQGSEGCHGAPLGDDEIAKAREQLNWTSAPFEIPDSISSAWDARTRGGELEQAWQQRFDAYQSAYPQEAQELLRRSSGQLPNNWSETFNAALKKVTEEKKSVATRQASQMAIEALAPVLPEFIGGSADLTGSNNTNWSGSIGVSADQPRGNYIYYGVREFAMSAIMNGLALHGEYIPYAGTFLTFSDYARNAVRMAALMNTRAIFVYTHDSIGLGEDGPTHQAVEHTSSLRYIPNLSVWRPCDTAESLVAWKCAIERDQGPSSLIFSRQGVPFQERSGEQLALIARGGYTLYESSAEPQLILIATGTEVALTIEAAKVLGERGHQVRVVSMPCTDVFEQQDAMYRDSVLPPQVRARLAIEAGVTDYWRKWVGLDGDVVGIDRFGASAPGGELMKHFGFTIENIVARGEQLINV